MLVLLRVWPLAARLATALALLLLEGCDAASRRRFEPAPARASSAVVSSARTDAGSEGGRYSGCVRAGRRCDIADVSCQRELFGVVQCLYGAVAGTQPSVRFVSTEVLAAEIRANDSRQAQERAALGDVARRLGLSHQQADTAPPDSASSPNAYYAPAKNEILVVQKAAIPTDGELAWLILGHEYVHALQNRKHDLERALQTRHERSFDQELALFAGVEGEAALYEQILRALHHGKKPERWVLERFEGETRWSDDAVLGQSRLLESSFGTFPYSYGAYWAARRWIDAPAARFDLGSTPVSTYEFLARRHEWVLDGTARAARAGAPCWDKRPWASGRLDVKESLGAWLIQAFVRKETRDADRARSIASALRSDSLSVYETGSSENFDFVWRTAWASPDAAHTMGHLIGARLRASAPDGGDVAVQVQGDALAAVALGPRARWRSAQELALTELAACGN